MTQMNDLLWQISMAKSKPFWSMYRHVMGSQLNLRFPHENPAHVNANACRTTKAQEDAPPPPQRDDCPEGSDLEVEAGDVSQEYLEFIKITRQHQQERERLKGEALKKMNPAAALEEYYKDISEVNTLVEDNLAEIPSRVGKLTKSSSEQRSQELIDRYGGREAYERVRSMEMCIDEHFKRQCQELSPGYWPVMPINPKPYLNPINE